MNIKLVVATLLMRIIFHIVTFRRAHNTIGDATVRLTANESQHSVAPVFRATHTRRVITTGLRSSENENAYFLEF